MRQNRFFNIRPIAGPVKELHRRVDLLAQMPPALEIHDPRHLLGTGGIFECSSQLDGPKAEPNSGRHPIDRVHGSGKAVENLVPLFLVVLLEIANELAFFSYAHGSKNSRMQKNVARISDLSRVYPSTARELVWKHLENALMI